MLAHETIRIIYSMVQFVLEFVKVSYRYVLATGMQSYNM